MDKNHLRFVLLLPVILFAGGCYSYSTVQVSVRNQVGVPLEGARVNVGYLVCLNVGEMLGMHPKESQQITGSNGIASVSVARNFYPPLVSIQKNGYESEIPLIAKDADGTLKDVDVHLRSLPAN